VAGPAHGDRARPQRASLEREMQFYATSLPGGKHNPNKVVTGFLAVVAGVVPPERVMQLARHLKDQTSFLASSPRAESGRRLARFRPPGDYWLGSTWAPTNCATVKGFQRAGRLDLARELAHRHLEVMGQVLHATGMIWENYCSEASARGSWSSKAYSWSAVGPIALLMEVVLGLEATRSTTGCAGRRRQASRWAWLGFPSAAPPFVWNSVPVPRGTRCWWTPTGPFTLELVQQAGTRTIACAAGRTHIEPAQPAASRVSM